MSPYGPFRAVNRSKINQNRQTAKLNVKDASAFSHTLGDAPSAYLN